MGISSFMVTWSLLLALTLLAIAFITWVLAIKESGWLKVVGQIIAVVIVVLTLLVLVIGSNYGMRMRNYGMGSGMMMRQNMNGGMMDQGMMQKGKMTSPMNK